MSNLLRAALLAREGKLEASVSFKSATFEELNAVCNGCGAANAKFDFVPDRIWGTYIGYACHIHDWDYDKGVTLEDKFDADKRFLRNLITIISWGKWYKPKPLQRLRAKMYYLAVKKKGYKAYWVGKKRHV